MFTALLRRKASPLIWQYLDGAIPADRLELLQKLLRKNSAIRRQFVDCAMLNALLFAYFNPGRIATAPSADGHPQPVDDPLFNDLADAINREDDEPRERRTKRPAG